MAAAEPSIRPLVANEEEVAEDPTIPPLIRKRKGKEVAETAAKKAKVSTPLLTGGTLRIGEEGENPPPVTKEGGAGSAAPASRPATEIGQAPPALPHLEPIERSAQRAAERSAPPSRVLEPSAEKSTPVVGTSSGDRKTRLVLRRGR